MRRTKVAITAAFGFLSSVSQTAVLPLGRGGSSRLSCSTLFFLPTRLCRSVLRGFTPTHKSVNNRSGVQQLAKRSELGCLELSGARRRGLVRGRF
jgi:hypothetical protein